jgi:hypothetical protein
MRPTSIHTTRSRIVRLGAACALTIAVAAAGATPALAQATAQPTAVVASADNPSSDAQGQPLRGTTITGDDAVGIVFLTGEDANRAASDPTRGGSEDSAVLILAASGEDPTTRADEVSAGPTPMRGVDPDGREGTGSLPGSSNADDGATGIVFFTGEDASPDGDDAVGIV